MRGRGKEDEFWCKARRSSRVWVWLGSSPKQAFWFAVFFGGRLWFGTLWILGFGNSDNYSCNY